MLLLQRLERLLEVSHPWKVRHLNKPLKCRTFMRSTFYSRKYQLDFLSFNGDGFGQLPGKTARTHQYAKVANYQGQPFVVGGSESGNKYS